MVQSAEGKRGWTGFHSVVYLESLQASEPLLGARPCAGGGLEEDSGVRVLPTQLGTTLRLPAPRGVGRGS